MAELDFRQTRTYEFIAAGIPRPEAQAWIGNRRVDFLWEKYGVVGEADGIAKYGRNDAEIRASITANRVVISVRWSLASPAARVIAGLMRRPPSGT